MEKQDLEYIKTTLEWLVFNTEPITQNKTNIETHCNIIANSIYLIDSELERQNTINPKPQNP